MSERCEILVGLEVADEAGYAQYREAMTPLLVAVGGFFRYDFRVERTLIGDNERINRVFVLSFPDAASKDSLFGSTEYQRVRGEYFDAAVASGGIIGTVSGAES